MRPVGMPTASENAFRTAISRQLGPSDRMLEGVRLSDPSGGDVEIDFLLLLPGHGIAVVEVKGGQVSFEDGQWLLRDRTRVRRIHPIEQARRGKHAVRRYLARQPEWTHELPIAEWFLALPQTVVLGDLGPEGRRELIFGDGELDGCLDRIKQVLDSLPRPEHRLTEDEVEQAAALLSGRVISARTTWQQTRPVGIKGIAIGSVAALALAGGAFAMVGQSQGEECSPGYEPCIPSSKDVDCSELDFAVLVIDPADPFELDRDGDGVGCESNATAAQLAELKQQAATP